MSAIKLREGVWSVGVLNPSLRVFDIVMESRYGTSYNAYLLTGGKNVLVETVHADYFEEYVENIRQIVPLEEIDCLIMNHTEPDHSGGVAMLLAACPKLKIYCSAAAKKHLGDITNQDFPCHVVESGDCLDMGDRQLEFISAPLLHWADSMFTWSAADKTLFTCDFLGAHFCEPSMLLAKVHDRAAYESELLNYYRCIFGPFGPAVAAGLDKLPPEAELVCASHGPCLTGEHLVAVKDCYRAWSAPRLRTGRKAYVVYASAYGCTEALAKAAGSALAAAGWDVLVEDVVREGAVECAQRANEADLLLVGAPTINKDAPKPIWEVLTSLDAINTKGRAAGAFGAQGWSGEAGGMMHTRLSQLRFSVPEQPFKVFFTPTQEDLQAMADYALAVGALVAPPAAQAQTPAEEKHICVLCGYVYDPAVGDPDHGIAPGTPFGALPAAWSCPLCGVDTGMFKPA